MFFSHIPLPQRRYISLALLIDGKFVLFEKQGEITNVYLFIFFDLNQTKPDSRVIMLFASPFTDRNEYKGKC